MNDLFDLPDLELPDRVRDSARQRILADLRRRPRAGRAPLLIAAAVVVLAAGTVVVASNLHHTAQLTPAAPSTISVPIPSGHSYGIADGWADSRETERCGRAAPAGTPPVAGWKAIATTEYDRLVLIAFRTGQGPVFCELTPAQVSVSAPVQSTPSHGNAAVLFRTRYGSYAGVVLPGTEQVQLSVRPTQFPAFTAHVRDGVFLYPSERESARSAGVALTDPRTGIGTSWSEGELPPVAQPVLDQPQPAQERTSPAGRQLAECFADNQDSAAQVKIIDPDYWTAGAAFADRAQLARYGNSLLACYTVKRPYSTTVHGTESLFSNDVLTATPLYARSQGSPDLIGGLVQEGRVASIVLRDRDGKESQAQLSNGTYLVDLNGSADLSRYTLIAKDTAGKILFSRQL